MSLTAHARWWLTACALVGCHGPDGSNGATDDPTTDTPTGATGSPVTGTASQLSAPAPNVVIVLMDDVGWTGLSGGQTSLGNGSDFHETPRMDALADQSVAYSAAYASPQCQPARAATLTGKAAPRTKMYANFDSNRADPALRTLDAPPTLERLPVSFETLPEMLAPLGYRTGSFGKWHIGVDGTDGPLDQGFEVNVGGTDDGSISGGSNGHFARSDGTFDGLPGMGANGVAYQFAADRVTDETLAWLALAGDRPSFAWVAHFSAHHPIQSPQADFALFENKPAGTHHSDPVYAGMLHNLDENVGRIVDYLEDTDDPRWPGHKLVDNTLLIVMSDNGGPGGYASEGVLTGREITNQEPLRSGKGTLWEGGIRVPLMIRWDRGGTAGRIVDQPVQHLDLVPTVLDVVEAPDDPTRVLDGISLRPTLEDASAVLDRQAIYFHFPAYLDYVEADITDRLRETPASATWDGRYKLTYHYEDSSWALYDLDVDLSESNDIAADHSDLVLSLGTGLVDWLVATGADMPLYEGTNDPVPLPDPRAL